MLSKSLKRYKILEWLGGGRFGDVYLVRDTLIKRKFAMKVGRGMGNVNAYIGEAKIISSLDHPNIVRFYTADIVDGRIIIITEYIQGETLRNIIEKSAPMDIQDALIIEKQMLDALSYAHKRGVIHRDLKPENIMIDKGNRVKVVDFGIAKIGEGDMTVSIAGTPPYMPKEVWKGKLDERSDQWSSALILYEMLTGINPFNSDKLDTVRKNIFSGNIPFLKNIIPDIPLSLERAIKRALSSDINKRFSTIEDFLNAINISDKESAVSPIAGLRKEKIMGFSHTLTSEQEEAVNYPENLLLIGGPGTGKTYTLLVKCLKLIQDGIPPGDIFLSTFTIKNWRDMETRLKKEIGEGVRDLWLGNIHTLSMRILRKDIGYLGLSEDFKIIIPLQQSKVMKEVSNKLGVDYKYGLNEIQKLKSQGFLPWDKSLPFIDEKILNVWQSYQEYLKKNNSMDFDDILIYTVRLLKDYNKLRKDYQKKFQYILIDEFQDLNPVQRQIIKLLYSAENRVFATADEDQMIYGWRGASRDGIRYFQSLFSPAGVKELVLSFRLPPEIMNAGINLISHNQDRKEKIIIPKKNTPSDALILKYFPKMGSEAEFIGKEIIKLVHQGHNYSDIAVIFRSYSISRKLTEILNKKGVPFTSVGGGFYERKEITGLINVLSYINKPKDASLLYKALNYPDNLVSKKHFKKGEIFEYIKNIGKGSKTYKRYKVLEYLSSSIFGIPIPKIVRSAVEFSGCIDYFLKKEDATEKIENIDEFIRSAEEFELQFPGKSLSTFLRYIKDVSHAGFSGDEGVNLLSVYKAKGLEFPIVFIFGLRDDVFPRVASLTTKEDLEEERRLMYVALTRATERVYLTYNTGYSYLTGEGKPSRFLREIFGQNA